MANYEAPKDLLAEDLSVSDADLTNLIGEVRGAEFNRLCERLFDLGIEPSHPHLFSTYIDGDRGRLLATPYPFNQPPSDDQSVTFQRLIFNRVGRDETTGRRFAEVDDFLVCFEAEALYHMHSTLDSQSTLEDTTWIMRRNSGPLIINVDAAVQVHYGLDYATELLEGTPMQRNLSSYRQLRDTLAPFTPTSRDEVELVNFLYNTKA